MLKLPANFDREAQLIDLSRADCEESLYVFTRSAFPYIDPATWIDSWAVEGICEHLQAVADGEIRKLILNISPRCLKTITTCVTFPAWVWAQPDKTPTSGPAVSFLCGSYGRDLSMDATVKCRQLINSQWYQDRWKLRFAMSDVQATKQLFVNDKGGRYLSTSVSGGTLGRGADIIIADDLNDAQDALSEASLEATINYWNTVLRTRLNNPKTGAFIVIQQRLAENDITGHILEKNAEDWIHVMIPMRYEPERSFHTVIGWKDPRTEAGELMWPERFGEAEVKSLETDLGPWACNPYEAPILMSDLTMKPIGEIKVGDEIIGFEKRADGVGHKDTSHKRMKLSRATVMEVHSRKSVVVKMTLDSGEVIRCTPDHKWYTKSRGPERPMYMPAHIGSRLARVCPASLPILTKEEEHDAGWLAGLFDGEGSVSAGKGANDEREAPASIIAFYQGSGRNKPLCDKLERLLTHFGFNFKYSEDERKPNKNAPCYGYRSYRLNNDRQQQLPMIQRFLHIVRPTKWRQRLLDGVYKSNFIQGRERVVNIQYDGEETVYALTTTTGNYVVWGLASSNSAGQLQQRPEPKGGGIIKREWWLKWEHDSYPPMDFVLATLDTAFTEDEMNDPSGMIIWGIFSGDVKAATTRIVAQDGTARRMDQTYSEFAPHVMCMYGWTARLELHELVEKVAQTCIKLKVDLLLIENKASGISVAQEIRRLYWRERFGVELFDPKSQDKVARLYSIQHLFAEGIIYGPDRPWMEQIITQVGQFPKGKHDEFVDLTSMGLRKLRDMGLLVRQPEREAEVESQKIYPRGQDQPLYPV